MGFLTGQVERRQAFPEPIIPPFPTATLGMDGGNSNRAGAEMTVPTVWSCVNLLANAVSMLPLETYKRASDGVPAKVNEPSFLTSPTPWLTQSEWLHQIMCSLLLRGNFYGEITEVDGYERPLTIQPLSPDALNVQVDRDTGLLTYQVSASQRYIPRNRMWHVRGMTMPGSKIGLSPIAYAAAAIGVDIGARQFGADFYGGGGIPKAILTTDMPVNQSQADDIVSKFMAKVTNRKPVVLPQGLTYQTISVAPEESQFLATQQANATQIARFFSVPAHMVDAPSGGGMTYSNVEQQSINFLVYSVQPWLKRIEDSVFGLLSQPTFAKFRTQDLLRTDAHTAAQIDMFRIAMRTATPTEIRAEHGQPPMTKAQKAEANLVPLGVGPLGRPTALPGLNAPNTNPPAAVPQGDQSGDNPGAGSGNS